MNGHLNNFYDEIICGVSRQKKVIAQSAGAVEYTDCFSAEG